MGSFGGRRPAGRDGSEDVECDDGTRSEAPSAGVLCGWTRGWAGSRPHGGLSHGVSVPTETQAADTATQPADTATQPADTATQPADTATQPADTAAQAADTLVRAQHSRPGCADPPGRHDSIGS